MTKILIFSSNFERKGGVTAYTKLLYQYLEKEKYEIKLFFIGKSGLLRKDIFYPFLILIQLIKLKKILKDFRPEIVHLNPSLSYTAIIRDFLFLEILKKEGYPVLFFIHGWRENISEKFQYRFFKNFFKKRLERADAIVVLANQFKEKLLDLGINSDKIYVLSTMVETAQYLHLNKNFSQPYIILFCAHMVREKGPYDLLNAAPLIIKKYPEISFIFVGDGKELKKLKAKSRDMGVEKNLHFLGYKTGNDKIKIFKQAHIFVFPSRSEGFPTVILEAMAAGLPLITTSVGGLADAIKDGKHGFIIDENMPRPKDIAEKIIYLVENPNLMKIMSENNMNEAKEKYDVKIVSMKIIEIYNNLLNRF